MPRLRRVAVPGYPHMSRSVHSTDTCAGEPFVAKAEKTTGQDLSKGKSEACGNTFRKKMILCLAEIRRVKEKKCPASKSAFSGPAITAPNPTNWLGQTQRRPRSNW